MSAVLTRLRVLEEARTPGEWRMHDDRSPWPVWVRSLRNGAWRALARMQGGSRKQQRFDGAFIAACSWAVPLLLDVAAEALRHDCYMHGVGSGSLGDRGVDCRMCDALRALEEAGQ